MADELERLADWASPLLRSLSAPRQRRVLGEIASHMRRSQSRRIAAQKNPDGSKFAPRKRPKKAAKPIRFIYKNAQGRVREAQMLSYRKERGRFIGFDSEAGGIRTFLQARVLERLKAKGTSVRTRGPKAMRKMFERMRSAQFMKRASSDGTASVYIDGNAATIARVHQYGLRDKVDRSRAEGPSVKYEKRVLLGFTQEDVQAIEAIVLRHLAQ